MHDNTSLANCKECGCELDKKILKGNTCMKCHSKKNMARKRVKRDLAIESLGARCKDCGNTFPYACYDFHHTDPTKKDECVSILIGNNRKLETILEEASKCELLCSNCHRLRHYS